MFDQGYKDAVDVVKMGEGVNGKMYVDYAREVSMGFFDGSLKEYINLH